MYSVAPLYLFAVPWTVSCQTPLSMKFSGQEYENEFPFPTPGDLPDTGIEPASPPLESGIFTTNTLGKPNNIAYIITHYITNYNNFIYLYFIIYLHSLN